MTKFGFFGWPGSTEGSARPEAPRAPSRKKLLRSVFMMSAPFPATSIPGERRRFKWRRTRDFSRFAGSRGVQTLNRQAPVERHGLDGHDGRRYQYRRA